MISVISAIQLSSVNCIDQNIEDIDKILFENMPRLSAEDMHLVVLPECCLYFGGRDIDQLMIAENLGHGKMQQALASLAKKHGIFLLAGTIPIKTQNDNKFTASSLLFSPNGDIVCDYQKMHLFDVDVNDSEKQYRESKYTAPGNKLSVIDLDTFKLGFSVCYDLRFAELFRALRVQGAEVIAVPSAFTKVTGEAHWQSLLRARAIENQIYIVAAGQSGVHPNGRETFGHSMIIDPWGEVKEIKVTGIGMISCDFDRQLIKKIRKDIPVAQHNKFSVTLNKMDN
ncbi:carbon-nitrogen hydrolase family protein [Thalassotalea crassostreae]|uniref:carbon-nitrogen hydrolase family protein n=1 Tax=Thalassotalea crassostreae TaxID=1763536 RepID=UPI000B03FCFA